MVLIDKFQMKVVLLDELLPSMIRKKSRVVEKTERAIRKNEAERFEYKNLNLNIHELLYVYLWCNAMVPIDTLYSSKEII